MHLYSFYKKGHSSIKSISQYSSYQITGFPKILSHFLYLLYYTSPVENLVRPTELYQILLDNNITKKEFVNFLNKSGMIETIKKAEKFSLKDFKEELNKDSEIDEFLKIAVESGYTRIGDNAEDSLNLLFSNIIRETLETSKYIIKGYIDQNIKTNPLKELFRQLGQKVKSLNPSVDIDKIDEIADKNFQKILNSYKKYQNNTDKFFENLEKMLNFVGDKMKRKLFKLYDMVPDTLNKSESIINWEIYNKLNLNKNKNIYLVIDFDKFKLK
jgi:hypothetical protein